MQDLVLLAAAAPQQQVGEVEHQAWLASTALPCLKASRHSSSSSSSSSH
jgi:hypothetical protein